MSESYDDISENNECEDPSTVGEPELVESLIRGLCDYDGHFELIDKLHTAIDALENLSHTALMSHRKMTHTAARRETVNANFRKHSREVLIKINAILDCIDLYSDVGSENLLVEAEYAKEEKDRDFTGIFSRPSSKDLRVAFESWWHHTQAHKHEFAMVDIAKAMAWEDCLYEGDEHWGDFIGH